MGEARPRWFAQRVEVIDETTAHALNGDSDLERRLALLIHRNGTRCEVQG